MYTVTYLQMESDRNVQGQSQSVSFIPIIRFHYHF